MPKRTPKKQSPRRFRGKNRFIVRRSSVWPSRSRESGSATLFLPARVYRAWAIHVLEPVREGTRAGSPAP